MIEIVYGNESVYEAFQRRIAYILSEFDNVYISFSGGKDSGLLLNLVLKYMVENGIQRRIGLMHQDFEAQYQLTTDFVTRTFDRLPEFVDRYWICLPMASKTSLSNYEIFWHPWDPEKRDIWVRPLPERPDVINLGNNPFDFYKPKMLQEDLYKQFGRWYKDAHGGGKTCALVGIRTQESLSRYSGIINKKYAYKGEKWITQGHKDVWTAAPLYDWTAEDIWVANGKFGFDYNRLYDMMYKAGLTIHQMRVASPFNEWAIQALNMYRIIEPETWAKLVGRVQGANFGAIYGATKAMGYKQVSLPKGHTWESYTKFLLSTLPVGTREGYLNKFNFSMEFWKNTGGGFSESVIEEIEQKGYKIRRNGISNFTKDGKERIVFEQEIPDNTDNVSGTIEIPSWKRMCYCILKNDHYCRFMGFGPDKEQQAKIDAIKAKYRSVIAGE